MTIKLSLIINKKISSDPVFQNEVIINTVVYEPNEKILTADVKYPFFCLIRKGTARVKIKDKNSAVSTVVAELKEDDVFGQFGLFDDSPASADVIASTRTEILQIDNNTFLSFLTRDSLFCYTFSLKIMQDLFQRIKDDNQKIMALMKYNLQLQEKLNANNLSNG